MTTIDNFKSFAGIYRPASLGSRAVGVLTVTKNPPSSTDVVQIPKGTQFSTQTEIFESIEAFTIPQKGQFIAVSVQAVQYGISGNIEASQTWSSSLDSVTIANAEAFSGGVDPVPEIPSDKLSTTDVPSDPVIQSLLNISSSVIKDMLGIEDSENLPDNDRIDNAVYLLTLFYVENRSIQERVLSIDVNELKETKTSFFRGRVHSAVLRQVTSWISKYRNHSKFIPGGADAESA